MYRPHHFKIQELVPQTHYAIYDITILLSLLDDRILWTADQLHSLYGPLIINDYLFNGPNQYRGWRPPTCSIGTKLSQHKFGRALDIIPQDFTVLQIRSDIINNTHVEEFKYITAVETDINWLHISCQNWDKLKLGVLQIKGK